MKHFQSADNERVAHTGNYFGESTALPIYFTVLVVLICGLVGYVILQLRLKQVVKKPAASTPFMMVRCADGSFRYKPPKVASVVQQTPGGYVSLPHSGRHKVKVKKPKSKASPKPTGNVAAV